LGPLSQARLELEGGAVAAGRGEDLDGGHVPALNPEDEAGAGKGRLPSNAEMQAFEAVGRSPGHALLLAGRLYAPGLALVYIPGISYSKSMNRNLFVRRPFRYSFNNLAIWLIAINVLVFAIEYLVPSSMGYLAMTPALVLGGAYWQPFTYMFAHGSLTHLLVNMLGLLFFGTAVEKELGSREFLLYYLLTGFLAGVFSFGAYLFSGGAYVPMLGASGAIFAVLLAFATLQPDSQILIWGIVPVRAPLMVLGYTAIEILSQVFGGSNGVAHLAHLAGFAFGWLYFLARFGVNPWRRFFRR
jgi:membrane associated rhomboid family serine protease